MGFAKRILGSAVAGATLLSASVIALPFTLTSAYAQESDPSAATRFTGTSYYVDCAANVDGNGTIESPYNSLASANKRASQLKAGESLLFKRGTVCKSYGEGENKIGLQVLNAKGTEDKIITIGAYGPTVGDKPEIQGAGVRDAVLVQNSEYIEVRDLKVTNQDPKTSDQWRYMRRGITVINNNQGELKHTVIDNNTVENVTGEGVKDLGGSGAIELEVFGSSSLVWKNNKWQLQLNPGNDKNNVPSWFTDTVVSNNTIYNVGRSGINMSTDYKCREESAWDGGGVCDANRREAHPWTPSRNLYILNNHLEKVGGDGIVVQMNDGAIVEGNYLSTAASRDMGYNAGIWNWNADNTLFQYNEVTNTQKLPGNSDGTAWDVDYGTRNTIFQYNYSHDNAGGALLWCGCGDWRVKSLGLETGATFRYNVSVNDGYSTTIESNNGKSSEQSVRLTTLQGAVDGRFYNNTVVLPKERDSVPFSLTSDRKNRTNIDFANNLIIGDGSVADESGKLTGASNQPHMNWTNNVYVGKDGGWPLAGKNGNQRIDADEFLKSAGTTIEALRSGDLSKLKIVSKYTAGKGAAYATEGTTDFFGNQVPAYSAPDAGAYQGTAADAKATKAQKLGTIAAGKTETLTVPADATVKVSAKTANGATLTASVKDGYVQTASGEGDVKSTYVRTSPTDTTLTIASKGGESSDVTVTTVDDDIIDGSFESIMGSPWSVGGYWADDNDKAYYDYDAQGSNAQSHEPRSDKYADTVATGDYSAHLGKSSVAGIRDMQVTTLNQRQLLAQPGATYRLGFWTVLGGTGTGDAAAKVTATIKYRKAANKGTGSAFDQYKDEVLKVSTPDSAKAGDKVYVEGTFTLPADAEANGALWLSIAEPDLALDQNTYIDGITLVRQDEPVAAVKTVAYRTTVAEGEPALAFAEVKGQPLASTVWQKKAADGTWNTVLRTRFNHADATSAQTLPESTRWLGIEKATKADAGEYRLLLTDAYGNTSTSEPVTITVTDKPKTETIASISVAALPNDTSYNDGESFNATGLKVSAVLTDGTSVVLDPSLYEVSGFDSEKIGRQSVRVVLKSDKTKATAFPVEVKFVRKSLTEKFCSADYVKASSIQTEYGSFPAKLTCDGNLSSTWSNWNAGDKDPWLSYSFDKAYELSNLEFYLKSDAEAAPAKFAVQTSTDGTNWTDTDLTGTPDTSDTSKPTVVDLSKLGAVQYLRLKLTYSSGNNFAKVAEVKIFDNSGTEPETLQTIDALTAEPANVDATVGDKLSADTLAGKLTVKAALSNKETKTLKADEYALTAVDEAGKPVDLSQPLPVVGKLTVTVTALSNAATEGDAAATATFTLNVKEADKVALNKAIAAAGKLNEADYTADSWKGFQQVLATAREVAANVNATQSEVDEARKNLADYQLVKKPAPTPTPTVVSIRVEAKPAKTEYAFGGQFSAAGLKVVKVLSDKTEPYAAASEYTLSAVDEAGKPVDLAKPFAVSGKVKVTVALKADSSKTASFDVTVAKKSGEKPAPTTPEQKPEHKPTPSPDQVNKKPGLSNTGSTVSLIAGVLALLATAGATLMLMARRRQR